jgi:hypothetical protein
MLLIDQTVILWYLILYYDICDICSIILRVLVYSTSTSHDSKRATRFVTGLQPPC